MPRFASLTCPSCGAPLPADALLRVVTCGYCGASVAATDGVVSAAAFRSLEAELDAEARRSADLVVAGVPYRRIAPIAAGARADVFLAERTCRLTERVVIKLLREGEDAARLDRAHTALDALRASAAQGAPQMSRRLPQLVGRGEADGRAALITRAQSGFVHTLDDVRRAHPRGLDPRHLVWIWRRILELLGWVHRSGWTHGAIEPAHAIVHARDHGVMLVSWSSAVRGGDPRRDLAMSARTLAPLAPRRGPLSALLAETARRPRTDDAWALKDAVAHAAREAYGPPKYVRLEMPGWR